MFLRRIEKNGMANKPVPDTDFENSMNPMPLCGGSNLIQGIKVYVDAYKHSKERIPLFPMYAHIMETVIVQDPVVYSFTTGPIPVYILPFLGFTGDRWIESFIPGWFGVYNSTVGRRGTLVHAWT